MKKNSIVFLTALLMMAVMPACEKATDPADIKIIPKPVELEIKRGKFIIKPGTKILVDASDLEVRNLAIYLDQILTNVTGMDIQVEEYHDTEADNDIVLSIHKKFERITDLEGYLLEIQKKRINIKAAHPAGLFYGMQTLFQLLPPEVFAGQYVPVEVEWSVPCLEITDKPAFSWRGMHLDVSRHFFPKEFIKKYIDMIAMHKMNVFHWHLTDDNGWRMEIMKYPKLTEIAAWRVDREEEPWRERELQKPGEKATYGGYYTQADIEEIIEYAQSKYITIIPEIEMPGHTSEVFAAYPDLSCTGEKLTVQPGYYWPNEDIFCAGKEETFEFLEDILTEVALIFPSGYIHIGGDEANKARWKECKFCQQRIIDEGLKDEDGLQSYFIRRIEKFLNEKGKKLIGWDEILEGGLAPEATVMSWRGFEGGVEAARMGHDVVMCPTSYCYFDYYQADPEFQPEAIGGFLTLKKVYSFDPVPPDLSAEEAKHVLGAQGNVWTEFIPTPEHAEYMAVPRMTALAEVVWSPKTSHNWYDFQHRMQEQFKRFDMMEVNYCEGSYRVEIIPMYNLKKEKYAVKLESEVPGGNIYYTLDNSEPGTQSSLYTDFIPIDSNTIIRAAYFKGSKMMGKPVSKQIEFHKAIGKNVQYLAGYSYKYPGNGLFPLVDGIQGSLKHTDGTWQGYQGDDVEVVIDLRKKTSFREISAGFLQSQNRWIFLPEEVVFSASYNGKDFEVFGVITHEADKRVDEPNIKRFRLSLEEPLTARYIKVLARNIGHCPDWHRGADDECWIFVDEIVVK